MYNTSMNEKLYSSEFRKLPTLRRWAKILIKIHSLPLFNKLFFIKRNLLKELKLPYSTMIGQGFYCCSGNLKIGNHVSLSDTFILDYGDVILGDFVSFSYKNIILTSTHDINNFNNIITKPVKIGSNVWITTGVIILPGVTIGSDTIIGAGSVVTKDIPSGVFAAGNPCKIIRKITFNQSNVNIL